MSKLLEVRVVLEQSAMKTFLSRTLTWYLVPISWFLAGLISAVLLLEGYHRIRQWQVHPSPVSLPTRAEVSQATFSQEGKRTMVALLFGQSNAANEGESPKVANERVLNEFNGRLYRAEDPLLGSTGQGGSVWTRLGDEIIQRKLYDEVVFFPMAVSATGIARWSPGGDIHQKLVQRIREAKPLGLTFTHLLWHQGESDALNKTSKAAYQEAFHAMLDSIRREGIAAPVYVAVATRCHKERPNRTIQEAQTELVSPLEGIYAGPNTDTLGLEYRYDGCHFTDEGLHQAALLWLEVLDKSLGDS